MIINKSLSETRDLLDYGRIYNLAIPIIIDLSYANEELSSFMRSGKPTSASRGFSLLDSLLCYTTSSLSNSANYRPHQKLAPLVLFSSVFSPLPPFHPFPSTYLLFLFLILCLSLFFAISPKRFLDTSLSTICARSFASSYLFSSFSIPRPSFLSLLIRTPLSLPPLSITILSTSLFPPTYPLLSHLYTSLSPLLFNLSRDSPPSFTHSRVIIYHSFALFSFSFSFHCSLIAAVSTFFSSVLHFVPRFLLFLSHLHPV